MKCKGCGLLSLEPTRDKKDRLVWYCENCDRYEYFIMHEEIRKQKRREGEGLE